jgi:2-polyprenyl-6-methoxyphenol hydroxylase-like FAD-dependent oxidoreductase
MIVVAINRNGYRAMNETTGVDVLVVGAGPTGLMLAASLNSFGVRTRIVDRLIDRAHESRALVVHARSLEIFRDLGIVDTLVRRGNTARRIAIHVSAKRNVLVLFDDIGAVDTEFPYILFISQAETEAVLDAHLAAVGQRVERGVEVTALSSEASGVRCTLQHLDGHEEIIRATYVAGCDGAHSFVRKAAGIPFEGDAYPQTFVLGDVEVDGPITPNALNLFFGRRGLAAFFPLGRPRTWRMIGIAPPDVGAEINPTDRPVLTLEELQEIANVSVSVPLKLRDPDWLANFRLHHRQATHYRAGRFFLAGDAAHVHSPAGGQGMNTGLQDAWNLGWKLSLAIRGVAGDYLLDSYEAERHPVGRFLLRYTDRLFGSFARLAKANPIVSAIRIVFMGMILPRIIASRKRRARGFRIVSQLAIRYRSSPIVAEGKPVLKGGPQPGDRFPDSPVIVRGSSSRLHRELCGPRFHILLCGPEAEWDAVEGVGLEKKYPGLLTIRHLAREGSDSALLDPTGEILTMLGVESLAIYIIRPDGHVSYRSGGASLTGAEAHLSTLLSAAPRVERRLH